MVCQCRFPSRRGEKHPNSKSGWEIDPGKPGCTTSCWAGETDPKFFGFLFPIPISADRLYFFVSQFVLQQYHKTLLWFTTDDLYDYDMDGVP